jgi:hypothetical protein
LPSAKRYIRHTNKKGTCSEDYLRSESIPLQKGGSVSTGYGWLQVEIIRALAALEREMPGRAVKNAELVALIFDVGKITEAQRVAVARALSQLESRQGFVAKVGSTSDVRWRISNNLSRALIHPDPEGTRPETYLKRATKWLKPATEREAHDQHA